MTVAEASVPLLADENVPRASVEYLRGRGYDVVWIAEVSPGEVMEGLLRREDLELIGYITVVKGGRVQQRPFPTEQPGT